MSCSNDKAIKIWNYENYELIHTIAGYSTEVISLTHIMNTKLIVSGNRMADNSIKIWNY